MGWQRWIYTLPLRVRSLFRRREVETELDEELREHLEKQIEANVAGGMSAAEARYAARRAMGGMELQKEKCRDARRVAFFEDLWQDIRYGARILGRTPLITAVAILSLVLGIGANTAIFSMMDAVLLRLLPVRNPQELVQLQIRSPKYGADANTFYTNPLWEQIRDRQDVFSHVFAWSETRFDLARGGAVQYVSGIWVSGGFFEGLGLQPAAGRLLTNADDQRGCPGAAVINYGFWQSHYGEDEKAIGSNLVLDGHPVPVVGVTPRGFYGLEAGSKFDVALPICSVTTFSPKTRLEGRSTWWLRIMGRLKSGTGAEQMKARLEALSPTVFAGALPLDWPKKEQDEFLRRVLTGMVSANGPSYMRRQMERPLYVLMAVVGLVLLIACANIASLMLARGAARQKEIAMRRALGASRTRLIRQLLTECILLSSAGALLGMFFARWGNAALLRYMSTGREKVFFDLSVSGRVLGFTALVAIFAGILFGALPAFHATRISLTAAMKGGHAGAGESRFGFRPGKWIVASQTALSLVLLVAAGLFLRSLVRLATLDIGFDRNNVLLVSANLGVAKIAPEQRLDVYEQIESALQTIPGAISVSRSWRTPVTNHEWNDFVFVDSSDAPKGDDSLVYFNYVSPGYFGTLRTPLLAGRGFQPTDKKNGQGVAVVNETMVRRFFHGQNPLGKTFRVGDGRNERSQTFEIVGLMRDAKYESLREETFPQAVFPISQMPGNDESEYFELRTAIPPKALTSAVQNSVAGVNKGISLEFQTLAEQVDDSIVQDRLLATMSGFFGGLALLLAMIGLFGAISYFVMQRQTEFGVRRALGAQPGSILGLVLREVLVILAAGVTLGVGIALASARLLQSLLFGLPARDTVTMVAAVGILSAVALLAGYLPARRAMRVDPMVALRYE
jgi:putative ABC transport system permease protein